MNLYVGNLQYNVSEDELKEVFEEYGEVSSVKIIIDRETGRSKGFGFVEMATDDQGNEALNNLNGYEISGRPIKVNEARERQRNDMGGRRNFRSNY